MQSATIMKAMSLYMFLQYFRKPPLVPKTHGPFGMDVLQSTLGKLGLRCWAGCGCCVLDGRALRAECWVLGAVCLVLCPGHGVTVVLL